MTGESSTAEREDSTSSETSGEHETASESRPIGESESPEASDAQPENADGGLTRRTFMRATGATAAGAAGVAASDDAAAQAQTYRFGGEVAGWQGREPAEIEGETNPTIELEAGQEYEFWFENLDGAPHDMTMQDANGSAVVQSSLVTSEGATGSVTFTATPQMTQYICTVHPTTMVGDLNVTGEVEGQGGLPLGLLLIAGGVALAFLSPLLFALFLFSRGDDRGGETTART